MGRHREGRRGFTLVEILLVVGIIAAIAGLMIPGWRNQQEISQDAQTKAHLESLRMAIELFYTEEGVWPANDLSDLADGNAPSGTVYLSEIPAEGVTDKNDVVNVPDYGGGWYWDIMYRELHVNLSGSDSGGKPYSNY